MIGIDLPGAARSDTPTAGASTPRPVSGPQSPAPTTTPLPDKQSQTVVAPPSRLKRRGLTVLAPSGLRTSAGQPVTSVVRGKQKKNGVRLFRVLRAKGALKVRTYAAKGVRLRLVQTAPRTERVRPFVRTATYFNGKRVSVRRL